MQEAGEKDTEGERCIRRGDQGRERVGERQSVMGTQSCHPRAGEAAARGSQFKSSLCYKLRPSPSRKREGTRGMGREGSRHDVYTLGWNPEKPGEQGAEGRRNGRHQSP